MMHSLLTTWTETSCVNNKHQQEIEQNTIFSLLFAACHEKTGVLVLKKTTTQKQGVANTWLGLWSLLLCPLWHHKGGGFLCFIALYEEVFNTLFLYLSLAFPQSFRYFMKEWFVLVRQPISFRQCRSPPSLLRLMMEHVTDWQVNVADSEELSKAGTTDGQMVGWTDGRCHVQKKVGLKTEQQQWLTKPAEFHKCDETGKKGKKRQTFQNRCTGRFVQLLFAAVSLVSLPVSQSGQGTREGFEGFTPDPSDGWMDERTHTLEVGQIARRDLCSQRLTQADFISSVTGGGWSELIWWLQQFSTNLAT